MKNAIVTGANGFIGSAVCKELLKRNVHVYAIVRRKSALQLPVCSQLHVVEADLSSYDSLDTMIPHDIDVFYHFAWDGTYGKSLSDYRQQIKNIEYACKAIIVAEKLKCKKFIMAGTINELELFQFFHAENSMPRPACIYGISKLSCDLLCKTLAAEMNMFYNTAIIGSCFGPGDKSERIHNVFIKNMLLNTTPKLVEAENLHDWVFIDEVASMFYAIGEKSVNMKNYYIGHNSLRKLKDILIEVRNILNPKKELIFGDIKDSFYIDYTLVDINALYQDTDYVDASDFTLNIMQTANWVKHFFLGCE